MTFRKREEIGSSLWRPHSGGGHWPDARQFTWCW